MIYLLRHCDLFLLGNIGMSSAFVYIPKYYRAVHFV